MKYEQLLDFVASHVLEKVTVNVTEKLTERQKLILCQLITTGQTDVTVNVTVNASSLALKNKVTERTIKRDLSILQKMGVLKRDGSDKTGSWVVLINPNQAK